MTNTDRGARVRLMRAAYEAGQGCVDPADYANEELYEAATHVRGLDAICDALGIDGAAAQAMVDRFGV